MSKSFIISDLNRSVCLLNDIWLFDVTYEFAWSVFKKYRDITGQRFWRLTAIEPRDGRNRLFACDCGNITEKRSSNVIHGVTKSCGCLRSRIARSSLYPNVRKPIKAQLREHFGTPYSGMGKALVWSYDLKLPASEVLRRLLRDFKL